MLNKSTPSTSWQQLDYFDVGCYAQQILCRSHEPFTSAQLAVLINNDIEDRWWSSIYVLSSAKLR